MKKLFIAGAFILTIQFTSAQSADFKKDVIEMIKISGTTANISAFLDPVIEQIAEEKRADFRKEIDAIMPELYETTADAMMKYYTHDDIKKMIEFYNSPVGKKVQEAAPKILKDQMPSMQQWQMQLQGILMKYMQ